MSNIWFVRAGRDGVFADDFLQNNLVAIGWPELGELASSVSKGQLSTLFAQAYPNDSDGKIQVGIGQVRRYLQDLQVGDWTMTYDRQTRLYHLGIIESEATYDAELIPELPRVRRVEWKHQISRDALSSATKNTLGAIQTLFLVRGEAAAEILAKARGIDVARPIESVTAESETETIGISDERELRAELVEKSEQAIEDRIARLDWEQMQELVAGVLRAMGYRTSVAARGSDRGVDIFASPDGLGLQDPRIFVEVKHRPTTKMGTQELRSFLGARNGTDKCLYVSTGGFTQEARYEADRSRVALQLLGIVELRRLFVEYYDRLDEDAKSLIALKRVYVLAD